jgi:hypothetical protein
MRVFQVQRRVPRVWLHAPLSGRILGILGYRLLDLSVAGARIAHYDPLRPGSSWTVELPATLGDQTLSARVVWTKSIGGKAASAKGCPPRYESGVVFTAEQQGALARTIERLTTQAKVLGKTTQQRKTPSP